MACEDEGWWWPGPCSVWSILLLFVLVLGAIITIVWLISWHLQEWRLTGQWVWCPDNEARLEALDKEEEDRLEKKFSFEHTEDKLE